MKPSKDHSQANGRLALDILDKGGLDSIVGLSGGPVFGIHRAGDEMLVHLIAIQSSWDQRATAFACFVEDVFLDWKQHLQNAS